MSRYQIYDSKVCDYIVVGEEEFTRRETAAREEARQQFLSLQNDGGCDDDGIPMSSGTKYFIHTHIGGFYETEEQYTAGEQSYRERCRIPEGSVPRLTNKQRVAWDEFLEKVRTFYKGRVDALTPELLREHYVDPWRVVSYQRGDDVSHILEALANGQ